MTYSLDFNEITHTAFTAISDADVKLVGTPDYMGVAYFWAYKYRHTMRDTNFALRRKVHTALLKARLPVDGESPEHDAIISPASNSRS